MSGAQCGISWGFSGLSSLAVKGKIALTRGIRLKFSFSPRQKFATALGGFFALGAAAAFSIVPGSALNVPQQLVSEPITLALSGLELPVVSIITRSERIQRGDSLVSMLARAGVREPGMHAFIKRDAIATRMSKSRVGQVFQVEASSDGRLLRLAAIYPSAPKTAATTAQSLDEDAVIIPSEDASRLVLTRDLDPKIGFTSTSEIIKLARTVEVRQATVRGSLFGATDAAGIPELVVNQLAEIFESDVDFDQDVRKGDTIRVVFETLRVQDGIDAPLPGRVLAAEFTNKKGTLNAVWFERDGGRGEYFSAEGKAFKKSFLRSPLEFTRVSSGFTESRKHPVFKDWRAHKGVDYAAPQGTKVRSIGDGVVDFAGVQRGYGNVVIIKHGDKFSTVYAHLNEFGKDIKVGKKVVQGDLVGGVGQTGWATGPHLHFEFRINNEPADPLNLALPPAKPMQHAELARFAKHAAGARQQLALSAQWRSARFE
jgi:murein DD-endopeptidase MepM/ murein hydrolase activator NlpD